MKKILLVIIILIATSVLCKAQSKPLDSTNYIRFIKEYNELQQAYKQVIDKIEELKGYKSKIEGKLEIRYQDIIEEKKRLDRE
jgi:predicted nuclease with TOPRIM domain